MTKPFLRVIIKIQKRKGNDTTKATRENILNILREHPGLRKREIAPYLHCHHFKILGVMSELEDAGLIKSIRIHDTASMEFYYKWYVAEDVLENGASLVDPDDL